MAFFTLVSKSLGGNNSTGFNANSRLWSLDEETFSGSNYAKHLNFSFYWTFGMADIRSSNKRDSCSIRCIKD
jgi:hypothetical protein